MSILNDEIYLRYRVADGLWGIVRRRLDQAGLDDVELHCDEASGYFGDSIEFRFSHVAGRLPVLLSIEQSGGLVVAPPILEARPVAGPYRSVREMEALISEAIGCVSGFIRNKVLVLH